MLRRKIIAACAAVPVAVLMLSGCAVGGSNGSDPNDPDQVEGITWWASGVEKAALYELIAEFTTANPEIEFIDASVRGADGTAAQAAIMARLEADNPPDTFQVAAGAALSGYVAGGYLQDLTPFFVEHGLTELYRSDLLELMSVGGKIYSVPAGIRRVNVMWANCELLRAAGLDTGLAATDVDTWLDDLERVRASGVEYPLALGDEWTQVQLFENVLLADLGAEAYKGLWTSSDAWKSSALRLAIDHYAALLEFTDPGSRFNDWGETAQTVVSGDAAYLVMADSALAAFQRAGFAIDTQYSASPMPGTAGVFDFTADSFTLPFGAVHERAARAWLLSVSSVEGQKALTETNGSIPARIDTTEEDYPLYQQGAITSLQLDIVVPSVAFGVAARPSWTSAIADAVVRFGVDGHPDALANALIATAEANLRSHS